MCRKLENILYVDEKLSCNTVYKKQICFDGIIGEMWTSYDILRGFFVFQTLEKYSQGWILISFDYVIQR